ncbi:hypothetical protein J5N97_009473 [Dioscorea zingiberensis]|uniref:trehalose-phosphatase n=1 Tax=Dioscorea zingiberensis TaxID=325984 RepID=A0A9D5CZF5_9LILI|nr:hypothetical protein J5N97_009473 [Dioscorea zingiberensis]
MNSLGDNRRREGDQLSPFPSLPCVLLPLPPHNYDRTLLPIIDDPDSAFMSDVMREAVRNVARYFPTAIMSEPCRDKVYNFVKLAELYYAGSHGMDIKGPAKDPRYTKAKSKAVLFQPASEFLPMIDEIYKVLLEKTKSISGAKVENNKFCVSVHYRCVDEKVKKQRSFKYF